MGHKFTPGPWKIDAKDIGTPWNIDTADGEHSVALAAQLVGDNRKQDQRTANAHLIAAAPELLAACKSVLASFERSDAEMKRAGLDPDNRNPVYVQKCREAIRKAEGENA